MKHLRFSSMLLLLAIKAPAGILLSDRFGYNNGPLVVANGSPWVNHGGTAQQVEVTDGVVRLSQQESEDVNAPLAGGPFNQGTLFASFTVNLVSLPSGDGGFFFHFKDGGSTQKARVFVSTNGAAAGRFRFGIANGSATAAYLNEDFDLTSSYRLVIRHRVADPAGSTLWVNPAGEADALHRVEATDTNKVANLTAVALRQSLSSGDGMGQLLLDDLTVGTEFGDVAGANTPPTISRIPDQETAANQPVGPLPFQLEDQETDAANLRVTLSSSNPNLLAVKGSAFQGTGANRTLRLSPTPDAQGVTDITLTVTDGTKSSSTTFRLTVGAPSLHSPARAEFAMNSEGNRLEVQVTDRETPPEQLLLTVRAGNPKLFPADSIQLTGSAATRSLMLRPAREQTGVSLITLTLTDGVHSISNQLTVTVYPRLGTLIAEPFPAVDGSLITPEGRWSIHAPDGGSPTNVLIQSGHLRLSEKLAEDVHVKFPGDPFAEASGTILYAAVRVRALDLPSSAGAFFGHFRDDRSGFRGRLYVATRGAAAGRLRYGVAAGAESPVLFPYEAGVGEDVLLVLKQNLTTGRAELWLNPESESDPRVVAEDEPSPITVSNWSFRQADGIGELWIDHLRIASSFAEAMGQGEVERVRLEVRSTPQGLSLSWPSSVPGLLQQRDSWTKGQWNRVNLPAIEAEGRRTTVVPADQPERYYRWVSE